MIIFFTYAFKYPLIYFIKFSLQYLLKDELIPKYQITPKEVITMTKNPKSCGCGCNPPEKKSSKASEKKKSAKKSK